MEIRKAKYGNYGEVTVLETGGSLSKILTDPADEFSYLWVKTEKLKFSKTAPVAVAVIAIPDAPEHGDVIATALASVPAETIMPETTGDYSKFVAALRTAGYTFHVRASEEFIEQSEVEYLQWTGGESLPEDCIYLRPGSHHKQTREWRLRAMLPANTEYPFPVVPIGVTGNKKHAPQGLMYPEGSIEVNFTEIAEQLVRAGLRVTAPGNGRRPQ